MPKFHVINLDYGDISGDGHEKTGTMTIESNYPRVKLYEAIKKSKFNTDRECGEYEEHQLSAKLTEWLVEVGLLKPEELGDEDRLEVWGDEYVKWLLDVIQYENPDFVWKELENATINVGGYGLFY